jgi:hypothetical protein
MSATRLIDLDDVPVLAELYRNRVLYQLISGDQRALP